MCALSHITNWGGDIFLRNISQNQVAIHYNCFLVFFNSLSNKSIFYCYYLQALTFDQIEKQGYYSCLFQALYIF